MTLWYGKRPTFLNPEITLLESFRTGHALEPDRALRNSPVGYFSEGDSLPRGLEPRKK